MSPIRTYSNKAEKYARFRWSYAPEIIHRLIQITGLDVSSLVIDLGAGTGILTRELVGKARKVIAIEPDPAMNRWIEIGGKNSQSLQVITARSEAVPLPAQCADVIVVAQAIHWFDPEPARLEIRRLLAPGGWLALLRNYSTDQEIGAEYEYLNLPENGVVFSPQAVGLKTPPSFYFGDSLYETHTAGFEFFQDWDAYLGSLLSASYTPDEAHPLFSRFVSAAREIFDRYSLNGVLVTQGTTELLIGKIH